MTAMLIFEVGFPMIAAMIGCKAFHSEKTIIDGVETAPMIRKGPLSEKNIPAYKPFMALAG